MARRHADGTLYRVVASGEYPSGQGWSSIHGPYTLLRTARAEATRLTNTRGSSTVRIEQADPTWTEAI